MTSPEFHLRNPVVAEPGDDGIPVGVHPLSRTVSLLSSRSVATSQTSRVSKR